MDDIESKVTRFIQGKHGLIGIIVPSRKPTEEEWTELHRTIAEIAVKQAKEEARQQPEEKEKAAQ
jgi:hypothetical protein